jgi:hypothetical protein
VKIALLVLLLLAFAASLTLLGCKATRSGYESAPYRVARSDGKFQIRDYPALRVAETHMVPDSNGSDGSFNRLFRFITGNNESGQKIAMTTPVFMYGENTNTTIAFVMPARTAAGATPAPTDASVKIKELPPGRFAMLRFSGGRNDRNEAKSLARLQAWAAGQGLSVAATPVYAYFDPPWTPAFLRRNEVMLRTQPDGPGLPPTRSGQ